MINDSIKTEKLLATHSILDMEASAPLIPPLRLISRETNRENALDTGSKSLAPI